MTTKKPNFLIVQADQLTARALAAYGNAISKTPTIDRLTERGVVFENANCNYPLCGPSRASMMSGLLPFSAGVYDNGTEFAATIPTFAHYLRILGYRTCLARLSQAETRLRGCHHAGVQGGGVRAPRPRNRVSAWLRRASR